MFVYFSRKEIRSEKAEEEEGKKLRLLIFFFVEMHRLSENRGNEYLHAIATIERVFMVFRALTANHKKLIEYLHEKKLERKTTLGREYK